MAGGAQFGYLLLWVVLTANLMGMVIQSMSAKLGIATGMNLPEVCRERFSRRTSVALWLQAEVIAMATDLAEFIGAAIGLNILFGIPLFPAALITSAAAFAILALQARGFRRLEAVIAAFIGVIVVAFAAQVFLADPDPAQVAKGFIPGFEGSESVLLAVGILGATVMPHVIYLHSALTQHRVVGATEEEKRRIFRFELVDVMIAMGIAGFVNMSMLVIAAAVFHENGLTEVGDDLAQVADQLEVASRQSRGPAFRRRAARVGPLVLQRRDARRSGGDAGIRPTQDPAVPAAGDHDGPRARDHRARDRCVPRPRAQPGRALVRDPVRADPAAAVLSRPLVDGLAREPARARRCSRARSRC